MSLDTIQAPLSGLSFDRVPYQTYQAVRLWLEKKQRSLRRTLLIERGSGGRLAIKKNGRRGSTAGSRPPERQRHFSHWILSHSFIPFHSLTTRHALRERNKALSECGKAFSHCYIHSLILKVCTQGHYLDFGWVPHTYTIFCQNFVCWLAAPTHKSKSRNLLTTHWLVFGKHTRLDR